MSPLQWKPLQLLSSWLQSFKTLPGLGTPALPAVSVPALPSELLQRIGNLHLHSRRIVAGLYQGARPSIRLGRDLAFAEYKPYVPGDPIRDIDWRVHARSDRLVLKRYQAETESGCLLLLDTSSDLSSTSQKWEQAVLLTSVLAHLLIQEREPVGLSVGGTNIFLPMRSGQTQLARILHTLASLQPAGRLQLGDWIRSVGEHARPRSLLALISDFAEEPSQWKDALSALSSRKVDVRAFQLYDQKEVGLEFDGPVRLFSPEAPTQLTPLDPAATRSLLSTEFRQFSEEVKSAISRSGGLYQPVEASLDLTGVLVRFLRARP
jgi:uncharacterized protein (DUF58 family)